MVGVLGWALVAMVIAFIPGFALFPWLASPFGPGLWKLSTPFARVFFVLSQVIRKAGVLVKRKTGEYEIGTYLPKRDAVQLEDKKLGIDSEKLRWGLFGKRKFGITWEPGTDLHQRIMRDESATDGGGWPVNIGAAHRYMRGANDPDAITRAEEKYKAEFGLGSEAMSDLTMAVLIIVMLLLGSVTTWFMLG